MFQLFRQCTRRAFCHPLSLAFPQASFSTSKNKVIRNKYESTSAENTPDQIPEIEHFSPNSSLRPRYIYSEREQITREILPVQQAISKDSSSLARGEATGLESTEEKPKYVATEGQERLSKRMSRLGVCSRRQAEKLIQSGIVKVNNKTVLGNVPVSENDKISIYTKHGEKVPMKEDTKLWIFRKPRGLICTHSDPQGRKTIFEYLREMGFKDEHFMSVGRLDFLSEGLILLTNDGELAQSLEQPHSNIERTYRVRVFGRFDEVKLQKIRKGVTINGIQYGPYWVEIENRQTRNTWLKMRLNTGKNREIRRVMQKFSLRVDRIQRIKYGPYTLQGLETGNWAEVPITPEIKRVAYLGLRKRLEQKQIEYSMERLAEAPSHPQLGESKSKKVPQLSESKPSHKAPQLNKGNGNDEPKRLPKARLVIKKLPAADKAKV